MSDDGFDDPFRIVKPDESNRKMSSYLKKQGGAAANNAETSSHGTSSTKSTTTSTVADNDASGLSKISEQGSRSAGLESGTEGFAKFSNSNGSNVGSGAIEFNSDFGNGLEFGRDASAGQEGGGGGSGGDGRHKSERRDRKKPSSRRTGGRSNSQSSINDDGFGSVATSSSHSGDKDDGFPMEAFGSNSFRGENDERFGASSSKKGHSSSHSSNNDGFFGSADAFANSSIHSGGNDEGFAMDAFANSSHNNSGTMKGAFAIDDFAGNSQSNNESGSDGFGQMGAFASFGNEREEPINFGNAFGGDAFAGSSEKEDAWKKRENWKKNARTDSSSSKDSNGERRQGSQHREKKGDRPHRRVHNDESSRDHNDEERSTRPRGGRPRPRRRHSNDPYSHEPDSAGGRSSRQLGADRPRKASSEIFSNDQSKSGGKNRERSPPRRNLSSRQRRGVTGNNSGQDSSDHRGETHRSGAPRSRRRQSIAGATKLDGSLEPASSSSRPKVTPRKNRSMDFTNLDGAGPPSMRQSESGNRTRARRRASCGTGFVDPMTLNMPQAAEGTSEKNKEWVRDRSRNQQMILDLYKGGGGMTKTDTKQSSMSELEIDFIPPTDLAVDGAVEDNESSFSRGFGKLFGKKGGDKFGSLNDDDIDGVAVEKPASMLSLTGFGSKKSKSSSESHAVGRKSTYADNRDIDSRKRTTLLERVGGDSSSRLASPITKEGGGLSYSDKIMGEQARSKK